MPPYRPNVGILVMNDSGMVLVGTRTNLADSKDGTFQAPQGGIDAGEEPIEAAKRELWEETGIPASEIELIAQTQNWYAYDFPDFVPLEKRLKYKGQNQKWFLFLYKGTNLSEEIACRKDKEIENFQWIDPFALPDLVISFKKDVYVKVIDEFQNYFLLAQNRV